MRRIFYIILFIQNIAWAQANFTMSVPSVEFYQIDLSTRGLGFGIGGNIGTLDWETSVSYLGHFREYVIEPDSTQDLHLKPKIRQVYLDLFLKKKIFKNFELKTGASVNLASSYRFNLTTVKGIDLAELRVSPEDFGYINGKITYAPVQPYVGLAYNGRLGVSEGWFWRADLGVYYLGKPKLNLEYEGFLETTTLDKELPQLQENLGSYVYYPKLSIGIGNLKW